jgi:hypothetical protein
VFPSSHNFGHSKKHTANENIGNHLIRPFKNVIEEIPGYDARENDDKNRDYTALAQKKCSSGKQIDKTRNGR